ncbi:indole-3-glycerol phosphate synthase TrpC [Putridiphycobacter roseus]|uniref:indole-3-glycerol-phosphate synthase n=1 Tax=Putridiphycobacter roseus TaxID=2219161 RepID=A0A2W1N9D3_9FLAO|nr:indole-3-glycerol phosphate synthase TrpC [Putridiphycobacter roseus]PZE15653.1 indole-3-glycerol phosphate synthase TrpC [Putridiphycobacter roseus]
MSILETIVNYKKTVVQESKDLSPVKLLEQSIFFNSQPISMKEYLKREDKVGIIAEIKRMSPSKGIINDKIDVEQLSISYMQSGASALSVLTDTKFFGGKSEDLEIARKFNYAPILRKDFMIDEYQIVEAKSMGADCILLIAACLTPTLCRSLASFAKNMRLEVLLEVRTREEIDSHTNEYIDIIGVNNRNLNDFKTDIINSKNLFEYLPKELVKISESGITRGSQVKELKDIGYDGFLIGGYFMNQGEPGKACKNLIDDYKSLIK